MYTHVCTLIYIHIYTHILLQVRSAFPSLTRVRRGARLGLCTYTHAHTHTCTGEELGLSYEYAYSCDDDDTLAPGLGLGLSTMEDAELADEQA